MRRFLLGLFSWLGAMVALVAAAGVVAVLGGNGLTGIRAIPVVLVNVLEAAGVLLPFAALGAAAMSPRLGTGTIGTGGARLAIVTSLGVAALTLIMVTTVSPAVRHTVLQAVYGAETPRFDPRGLTMPALLQTARHSDSLSAIGASVSVSETLKARMLRTEMSRRSSSATLALVLSLVGWLVGWWLRTVKNASQQRLLIVSSVFAFLLVSFLADLFLQGTSPGLAYVGRLAVPVTVLIVLAFCSWLVRSRQPEDASV